MSSKKPLVVLAALAATFVAGVAQARGSDDVRWSVTIGTPAYVPVHVPAPIYAPAPVYATGPAYLPGGGYARPPQAQPHRVAYGQPTRWDVDGDGIPNRYDRVYNPRWDRDGDGVPNRRDPRPDGPYRGGWDR